MVDKDFYNEASAAKLGWDPSWFGLTEYDSRLTKKIRAFQKEIGLNIFRNSIHWSKQTKRM